ncbi:grasp-with-spasm system SPASM domain peptide maturase [Cellulophaga lytica]|uniref:grasp-with-spasm system SPASM domain peptide maturase n=1 Tax=Cellulophaga lytica TaxID=979 RepID=UPI0032E52378
MIDLNSKFKLISNCIPVKGAQRSIICDLHRKDIDIIPNDLFDILNNFDGRTIKEVQDSYDGKYNTIIFEYFEFLYEKDYIFFTETPDLFPKMSKKWFNPSEITNAIIDIDSSTQFNIVVVLSGLNNLNCKFLEIRFFKEVEISVIRAIVDHLDEIKSSITSVTLKIPFTKEKTKDFVSNFIFENPRISSIMIYSSPTDEFININNSSYSYIYYSKNNIENEKACGIIDSSFFAANIKNFTESLKFNSCLNCKLSIDKSGFIRNCPSMAQDFGNVKDVLLEEAFIHKDFKKYWNINKDQIDVCKDCEFRYVCTDCRAYIENPKDDYSKPLKCGYDPYTSKWYDWSTNPLKEKAIEYYGMQDIVNNDI